MKTIKTFMAIFICMLGAVLLVSGCGGGGGGDTDGANIRPTMCPGIVSESASEKKVVFISVNQPGIYGYLKDSNGTTVLNSELRNNSLANTSERMVEVSLSGNYTFVYRVNSEEFETTAMIDWTILPKLRSTPVPEWLSDNRTLTVTHSGLDNSAYANFYLQLYHAAMSNSMYYQTSASQGNSPLTARVTSSGDYVTVYVADIIEGDQLKGTLRYNFGSIPMY